MSIRIQINQLLKKKDSTSNVSLFENKQQVIVQDEHDLISKTEEKLATLQQEMAVEQHGKVLYGGGRYIYKLDLRKKNSLFDNFKCRSSIA